MSKILIVGNVLKDTYLRLDERHEELETDRDGVKWLNWSFDDSSHEFFNRESIFSGAVVTLEVLKRFGLDATIYRDQEPEDSTAPIKAVNYRYILCAGDQISYLVPSEKRPTKFTATKLSSHYDWIFIDRSAIISRELVTNLLQALSATNGQTKLAVYAPKQISKFMDPLFKNANLIFTDHVIDLPTTKAEICMLSETGAKLGGAAIKFRGLKKTALFTHLTTYSIISATILGSITIGKSKEDQLLMAKMNIEHTKLDQSLSVEDLERFAAEEKASAVNLRQMAEQLVSSGKGILAADESGGSIHKKFESMNIPDDFTHRRDYRNLFFATKGLEQYVNGVILFDETARQISDDGRDFTSYLTSKGIIPGIKVDKGLANMPGSTEKYTLGLTGLDERLDEYYSMGLRFAKWRAAFEVTEATPTKNCIAKNAEILAEYALKCQEARIVPIVEPEVVFDGDYSIEQSANITGTVLKALFEELKARNVDLAATLLKVNMVIAGKQFATQSTPKEVAEWTAKTLRRFVPEELAGIVFLSGGQTPEQATDNLQAITDLGPYPWPVTFSYARALQGPALEAWKGDNTNYPAAQAAFLERLKANCQALKKSN